MDRLKWAEKVGVLIEDIQYERTDSAAFREAVRALEKMARLADRYEETQRPAGYQDD